MEKGDMGVKKNIAVVHVRDHYLYTDLSKE